MPDRTRSRPTLLTGAVLALAATAACSAGPQSSPASSSGASAPATASAAGTPSSASVSPSTSAPPEGGPSPSPSAAPPEPAAAELPRGGREIFPRYRLVGYAGVTGIEPLGRLGVGDVDDRVRELQRRAQPYARNREVMPVLEIIATIVHASPGKDGQWRTRMADDEIRRYLKAARKADALLLLNIQPGQSSFLAEAKAYEEFLREPDVGIALDPEWAMHPGQVPGRAYGWSTGKELDGVARYLSRLVREENLPEKAMVYHQVAASVVRKESGLKDHPGVAAIKSVDGIGSREMKITTYNYVNKSTPDHVHAGFKLFYVEDRKGPWELMTPKQVLALRPRPAYVMYE